MSRVRSKDTTPELVVRSAAHRAGLRFRLHGKSLPGKPDLVFAGRKLVVFVHGCFWHRHPGCARASTPARNKSFWAKKFRDNIARDRRVETMLAEDGWKVEIVWECQTKNEAALISCLRRLRRRAPLEAR